jgi:hypothetical protein
MINLYRPADLPTFLKAFLPNPIGFMKRPFQFTWVAMVILLAACASLSGTISGLISGRTYDVLIGALLFPVTSLASSLVFGFFIYYFFSLFRSTFLDFRRLMSVIAASFVPYFLFHSVSPYLSPIDLVGFAFAGLLMIVGLVEQFGLERRTCSRLIGVLGIVFFVAWSIGQIGQGS